MAVSSCIEFQPGERRQLLAIAAAAIDCELRGQAPTRPELAGLPPALQVPRGVFVTLKLHHDLRGCIGSLEAGQPLALATAEMARAAAVQDPRFPPLRIEEWPALNVEISVLTQPAPLPAQDRAQLLQLLSPGEDGLLLEEGSRQATFLPQVWRQLEEPAAFWEQLLAKAGLPPGHWSASLRLYTYRVTRVTSGPAGIDEGPS